MALAYGLSCFLVSHVNSKCVNYPFSFSFFNGLGQLLKNELHTFYFDFALSFLFTKIRRFDGSCTWFETKETARKPRNLCIYLIARFNHIRITPEKFHYLQNSSCIGALSEHAEDKAANLSVVLMQCSICTNQMFVNVFYVYTIVQCTSAAIYVECAAQIDYCE